MFGFNRNKKQEQIKKDLELLANINLFSFLGADLPIINGDANQYINKIWRSIGVVYTATSLIYEKTYQCPLVFYKVKNDRAYKKLQKIQPNEDNRSQYSILKAQALEEVDAPSGLDDLIKQPNPQQRWSDFLGVFCLAYLLTGNSYVYKNVAKTTKKPLEMWAFPELHIESGGMYNPIKSYYQFFNTDSQKQYPAETIYHARTPNPAFDINGSQLYGVSPLRAFLEPLRTIEESYKQASKQMFNGGVLALMSPRREQDGLTAEQRNAFMDKFKNALRSSAPGNRFLTSSIAMDVQKVGLPSVELDLLNIRSADEKAIYKAYKIPLARYSQEASTYNNQAESNKQLVYDAVSPIAKVVSDMLTNFIGIHYGVIIELDPMQLPEMAVNMKEQLEWIVPAVNNKVITPDEARFQLGYTELNQDYSRSLYHMDKPLEKIYDGTIQSSGVNGTGGNENKQGA